MDSFRLSYGPRRDFSCSKTLIGYGIIFVGLSGALVAALFAEGRADATSSVYLPGSGPGVYGEFRSTTGEHVTCGRTNVYAGQTFDAHNTNASFSYTALNSFSYGGEQLSGCIMDESVQPTIIVRPPVTNPSIQIMDAVVICNTSLSTGGARFSPINKPEDANLAVWIPTILLDLHDNNVAGFRVSLNLATTVNGSETTILIYSNNGTSYSIKESDPRSDGIQLFIGSVILRIQDDFGTFLGDPGPMRYLPDVLYPCVTSRKVWRPAGYLVWFSIATLFAFSAPLYFGAVWILRSSDETRSINSALNAGSRRNSALSRVLVHGNVDNSGTHHIPMSPTSPIQIPPYRARDSDEFGDENDRDRKVAPV